MKCGHSKVTTQLAMGSTDTTLNSAKKITLSLTSSFIDSPAGLESLAVDRERSRDEWKRERKTKESNDTDGHGSSCLGSAREWEALRAKRCGIRSR